ncbi:TPA: FKBP-type peptidyl-prolyl cis-trans isomerase [Providencia stuartii]|uniref:FKBP-type peptidyl-prolyl cis-trans isomerase N-terminal domain-containing protein n=1 Tax=Providencia TaxID=586 RepID=UPI00285402B3|nr:FKBP-type peptidyl-prolyl cis-trans isomerase N-terminal domain-containing protein [Providencia manganoxydans]MDX4945816.1 FKBP-type peptidyl-prolyl cis-trans isomerase N-terminal domain-containing protein [Providencia manganoxydans]HEF8774098.1 FKBP-type peptidyl-prolyl cis-trans isomerase [Providencia stuartii]
MAAYFRVWPSRHWIFSFSLFSALFIIPSAHSEPQQNSLPGLLQFAQEYEARKTQQTENSPDVFSSTGIQLPQIKLKILQQQLYASQRREQQYREQLQQLQADVQRLNNNLQLLTQKNKAASQANSALITFNADDLKKNDSLRQAYAAGIAIGQDALTLHQDNQSYGQSLDKQAYLAGITDAIEGRMQLSPTELHAALIASQASMEKNKREQKTQQLALAKRFLTEWKKQKEVKSDPMGYDYKINYLGQGKIKDNDVISIVVKESLLDGTVVSDMELQNKSLTLPLDNYPPLFQSAIRHLQNHGEITFVVPPELAYGDEGYPPSVPPGASLIYTLRIADIQNSPIQ